MPIREQGSSAPNYHSYLLRLRWYRADAKWICQSMLINVNTQEHRYFSDLAGLFAYLNQHSDVLEGGKLFIQQSDDSEWT